MNQNTIKVLLADDNKDFCDIIVDHLNKQEDITVVAVAMDGIDAMNKIRDTHPDVAVIDGIMPRLGLAFWNDCKKRRKTIARSQSFFLR